MNPEKGTRNIYFLHLIGVFGRVQDYFFYSLEPTITVVRRIDTKLTYIACCSQTFLSCYEKETNMLRGGTYR